MMCVTGEVNNFNEVLIQNSILQITFKLNI